MFRFENPAAFLLLLAMPVFFALRKAGLLMGPSLPVTLGDWQGKVFRYENRLIALGLVLSRLLAGAAFGLTVIALADPVLSRRERVYLSRGADIVFVVDTSPSMAARDMQSFLRSREETLRQIPRGREEALTRLDAARLAIRRVVKNTGGAAFGLVALASEAALMVPATTDHDAFFRHLDSLVIGALGDGSALGTGLSVAAYHLIASKAPKKCVVLLTDGENNAGSIHPASAARLAAANGIIVYTLGVGTTESAPIRYRDPGSGDVYEGFLESSFDEESLRHIASQGGGAYHSVASLGDLEAALSAIASREQVRQTWLDETKDDPLYLRFALSALAAWALFWLIHRLYLGAVL
ncbi:MAG: VWA domain-containing protein [Spirochaetaceae bacterium]|jgi:Ca-activated chloride channel family protein|nr:VWA domain-containing protein [Spirochaetaceae bacterium]